ncbi:MAG TPA: hypothetical protein VGL80_23615 [Pseudonocardiaceae bacterium]
MRRVTGIAAGAVVTAAGLATAACLPGGGSAAGTGNSPTASSSTTAPSTAPSTTPATTPAPTPSAQPGTPADTAAVVGAFDKTMAAGSARIATTTEIGAGQQNVPIDSTGTIGFANQSADLTETLPGGQGSGETRFVNGVLYERLPSALVSRLSNGKPWISLNVAALSRQGDGSLQQLMTDSPSDPSTVLGFLRGVDGTVGKVGPDTVDGSQTTHYDVTLNLDKAAEGQSTTAQQAIHTLERELGSHTLPAQVWIDDAGRLRKISTQENIGGRITFGFTAILSDFGVPVKISPPPAGQVTDLTSKLSGGGN